MKILFGTDIFYQNVSGAGNFIQQLSKGLISRGHEIFVIAPSKSLRNTVAKEGNITIYGIRSVLLPEMIYPSNFRVPITAGSNKIRTILEEVQPDVINIQDHFMVGNKIAKEAKRLGIPVVGTNHFMPENFIHYFYPPEFAKNFVKKLAWKDFARVYKNVDVITTPTKTAADLIKNLGLKSPIIAISNGVDLDKFNIKNNGDLLKKRYGIPPSTPVILFVGRLDKEKHIDLLIKAFAKVLPHTKAKLVITGKGTERASLTQLAKRLGIEKEVIFTGFIPDSELPSLYRIGDVFAIASIAELQSIATMEAMASGLPVIAAKVIALPELVHEGENGYLFDDGDIVSLSNHMLAIIQNPTLQKKLSENSLKIIKQHDIKNTVAAYEETYQQLQSSGKLRLL